MLRRVKKAYKNICLNEEIKKQNESIEKELITIRRHTDEILFANRFHDVIKQSTWYEDIPLSFSDFAIGYNMAYLLFKILDQYKPKSILEIGLGQSTLMISQYTNKFKSKHHVVENNKDWIKFFESSLNVKTIPDFHCLPKYTRTINGEEVNAYKGFEKEFKNEKFDLMMIDGPNGSPYYSRMDVLDIIPKSLNKSFIILLDDAQRPGEIRMFQELEKKLNENNIKFKSALYPGNTDVYICVSEDLSFMTSM